jgi:hypothetical protein
MYIAFAGVSLNRGKHTWPKINLYLDYVEDSLSAFAGISLPVTTPIRGELWLSIAVHACYLEKPKCANWRLDLHRIQKIACWFFKTKCYAWEMRSDFNEITYPNENNQRRLHSLWVQESCSVLRFDSLPIKFFLPIRPCKINSNTNPSNCRLQPHIICE